ncbi:4-(cytidine 5'-diphospho)-2-C-methyl-D-erythritol kinase [Heliobacterium chlorum]|uniref:4-(cytidine 5'-diphospho)-2-C-methyl-D-erythritol kinase n=1 Tax=Heliobacterium chlorum TaxID=2698 RepID=UPI001FAC846C|nr:4-(cytidine 5'-diphospho)-2-C-methyl-D-erythritol kinase [Heliobacterium chlorum]
MLGKELVPILRMQAPAKINLTLDVLGRRADGYHQVVMVMQTVDLVDVVMVSVNRNHQTILLQGGSEEAPPDQTNLVYRTAALVQEQAQLPYGVEIELDKQIPVAAGLAGGSSDAAATMKALNRLFSLGWDDKKMESLLARLGSDIPFLVRGGTALATGRGEALHSLPAALDFWVILVKPPFGASTPQVYKALNAKSLPDPLPWPEEMTPEDIPEEGYSANMLKALRTGSYQAVLDAMGNDLEKVTLEWFPELKLLKEKLLRLGCDRAMMSGSGPTILGFTDEEAKARSIAEILAKETQTLNYRVMVARTLGREEADEWIVDCCR